MPIKVPRAIPYQAPFQRVSPTSVRGEGDQSMTGDPWSIDERAYPREASAAEQLRYLVHYAVLAPSNHNTQPWRFALAGKRLSLYADRSRRLPVVDPYDRELIISCGAALGNLEVAMRHYGREPDVRILPDPTDSDLLAQIALGTECARLPDHARLFASIPQRRTTREVFSTLPIPTAVMEELLASGAAEQVAVQAITEEDERMDIATLVDEADHVQFDNPSFRAELAEWIRARDSTRRDGVSADGLDAPEGLSRIGALAIRTFDIGRGVAARDTEIATGSPLLMILSTAVDSTEAWLRTGRVLSRMLLRAASSDVTASYLNQPIEVPALRKRLAELVAPRTDDFHPQLLLRFGYSERTRPSARRPVADVLEFT